MRRNVNQKKRESEGGAAKSSKQDSTGGPSKADAAAGEGKKSAGKGGKKSTEKQEHEASLVLLGLSDQEKGVKMGPKLAGSMSKMGPKPGAKGQGSNKSGVAQDNKKSPGKGPGKAADTESEDEESSSSNQDAAKPIVVAQAVPVSIEGIGESTEVVALPVNTIPSQTEGSNTDKKKKRKDNQNGSSSQAGHKKAKAQEEQPSSAQAVASQPQEWEQRQGSIIVAEVLLAQEYERYLQAFRSDYNLACQLLTNHSLNRIQQAQKQHNAELEQLGRDAQNLIRNDPANLERRLILENLTKQAKDRLQEQIFLETDMNRANVVKSEFEKILYKQAMLKQIASASASIQGNAGGSHQTAVPALGGLEGHARVQAAMYNNGHGTIGPA
mmetsp:Transcript_39931/g.62292  ORF Transcript_39931/g.62292 Transcript_39931/m.62292 type:complete len:384 (-) Transcript_39931:150-1301(-)